MAAESADAGLPVLSSQAEISAFLGESPIIAATIRITRQCDCRCDFCYSRSGSPLEGELGFREWSRVLEQLRAAGIVRLFISGGEPTLFPEVDKLILQATDAGIYVALSSNGYRITPDLFRRLVASRLSLLQLSVDGPPGFHDYYRGIPGLYAKCMGILKNASAECGETALCVATIIMAQNLKLLPELYARLVDSGCKRWVLIPITLTGKAGRRHCVSIGKLLDAVEELSVLAAKGNELVIVPLLPPALIPKQGISPRWRLGYVSPYPSQIAVDANGDLAFADIFINHPAYIFGNAASISVADAVQWAREYHPEATEIPGVRLIGVCSFCMFNKICCGGDRALSILENGSLYKSDLFCQEAFDAGRFPGEYYCG